ncbi:PREDICTED: NKG2-D type II integral membrane protein [Condylura cristata]|uniref:NKG2-D type II integral membrane protein n=1 Tax=Condylura cristata TaxID=143302 RepID=UPI00033477D5|nr:PREDICTED: NKG2-D type II integral membrane protein [Condylura cristata]
MMHTGLNFLSSELNECHGNNFQLVKQGISTGQQRKRTSPVTTKVGENSPPFILVRSIAVALGIHFVVMTVIYGVMAINLFFNQGAQVPLKGSYYDSCPVNWIHYKNKCYKFFNENKNWHESQASCKTQNSTLLKIYSQEDQDFFKLVKSYHWMGLTQILPNRSWQWEDGSILSPNQVTVYEMQNGSCAVYGSDFKGYTENCFTPNTYICMQSMVSRACDL